MIKIIGKLICWIFSHKSSGEGMMWIGKNGILYQMTDCIYCRKTYINQLSEKTKNDINFWKGFDAAIDMVMNVFDSSETIDRAELREEILESAELYKKDG